MFAAPRTFMNDLRRRMEIDDGAVQLETCSVVGVEHGAPAGRKHDVFDGGEIGEHGALALTKTGFAFDLEYNRNAHSEAALELRVCIIEGLAEAPRKKSSERRLAASRQADQKQIAPMQLHRGILL